MQHARPEDDDLHPVGSEDPFWTETAWFAFSLPERGMTGYVYPVFRPNLRICSSGLYLWDASGEREHEARYFHNYWHLPLPETLTSMRLASGLSYDVLEPNRAYRVRYASDRLALDLTYTGLVPPVLTPSGDHLDQPCRVLGTLRLDDEEYAVDGVEMRDKSWHVRSDASLTLPERVAHGAYTYAISDTESFLVRTMADNSADQQLRRGGWLLRDGVLAAVVSGRRTTIRDAGRPPTTVTVEATDELGRTVHAVGTTLNRFALRSTPAMVPWISGTAWELAGGASAWGQDQEWYLGADEPGGSTVSPG
jgi:hypothetical protein